MPQSPPNKNSTSDRDEQVDNFTQLLLARVGEAMRQKLEENLSSSTRALVSRATATLKSVVPASLAKLTMSSELKWAVGQKRLRSGAVVHSGAVTLSLQGAETTATLRAASDPREESKVQPPSQPPADRRKELACSYCDHGMSRAYFVCACDLMLCSSCFDIVCNSQPDEPNLVCPSCCSPDPQDEPRSASYKRQRRE